MPNIPPHCIVCQATQSFSSGVCRCCGADNDVWFEWQQSSEWQQLWYYWSRSPWGWLALVSLLLPVVGTSLLRFEPAWVLGLVTGLSLLISGGGLTLFYFQRDALFEAELIHQWTPRSLRSWFPFRHRLRLLACSGSLLFIAVGGAIGLALSATIWHGTPLLLIGPSRWGVILLIGLSFTAQALAAGIFHLLAYGNWRLRTFLPPLFFDQDRLLALALADIEPRLKVKARHQSGSIIHVVLSKRSAAAGLDIKLCTEAQTDEVYANHYLVAVQHWQAISNCWGRISQLQPVGPLEHQPDFNRTYTPPTAPPLQGELILPARPPQPTIEARIIRALIAPRDAQADTDPSV